MFMKGEIWANEASHVALECQGVQAVQGLSLTPAPVKGRQLYQSFACSSGNGDSVSVPHPAQVSEALHLGIQV